MFRISEVETDQELKTIRILFKEYTNWLGFDLSFQNFDKEFAELPGQYAPPKGRLLLAYEDDEAVGCVGLREFQDEICEMKRLYIKEQYRSKGYGRKLAEAIIAEARKIGYKYMRLDTVPWMKEAIGLYRSMRFYEIEAYRFNPIKGTLYFELKL
ncbi:MAG: GNAT family N-acetyltransferase [candidate division WOR-3 bacterium]